MAIFEKFPYSDLHNLNLDWIIEKVKQWAAEFEEYKTELETLESTVQGLINTVDQQDEDIQAALGQLQTALAALPQDIQDEVAEQIGPAVASRIGNTVASQLPDVVTSQIGGAVDDWMEDNFTNPPFDPYLTRDLAVPVAKDMGDRFDYLKTLQIEGYTPAWSNAPVTTVDDAGFWKADGTIDSSDSTTAAGYCTSEPGVSYRFTEWMLRNTETVAVLFCRGTISDKVVHSYINKADLGDYETASGSGIYIIPVPYGCNLMLVNGIGGDPPDFPVIAEQTLNFRGGTRVRSFMQIAPGGDAVYASDYPSILNDIQKGVPVSFNNVPDQTSTTYFTVVGYSVNYQANTIDIAMVSPDKKLLTARLIKTTAGGIDYAMITSIEETSIGGGSPGPSPVSSSIVVNLTAGQNNTFTGDISLEDLQSALDDAESVWLSYPGATANDYDMRQVVEYNQDLTDNTSLRIGVFSEDEYIVYSVVDNGNDGVTLTVVSEKGLGVLVVEGDATDTATFGTAFMTWVQQAGASAGQYVQYQTLTGMPSITDRIIAGMEAGRDVRLVLNFGAGADLRTNIDTLLTSTTPALKVVTGKMWYDTGTMYCDANIRLSPQQGLMIEGIAYTHS